MITADDSAVEWSHRHSAAEAGSLFEVKWYRLSSSGGDDLSASEFESEKSSSSDPVGDAGKPDCN